MMDGIYEYMFLRFNQKPKDDIWAAAHSIIISNVVRYAEVLRLKQSARISEHVHVHVCAAGASSLLV